MVYVPLQAMRVGLLTRFFATLGMALGVSSLFIVPALSLLALMIWFGWLGFTILDRMPKGRPPAWDAGEAIPWPKPGEAADPRAGRRPAEVVDGDATEVFADDARGARPLRAPRARAQAQAQAAPLRLDPVTGKRSFTIGNRMITEPAGRARRRPANGSSPAALELFAERGYEGDLDRRDRVGGRPVAPLGRALQALRQQAGALRGGAFGADRGDRRLQRPARAGAARRHPRRAHPDRPLGAGRARARAPLIRVVMRDGGRVPELADPLRGDDRPAGASRSRSHGSQALCGRARGGRARPRGPRRGHLRRAGRLQPPANPVRRRRAPGWTRSASSPPGCDACLTIIDNLERSPANA